MIVDHETFVYDEDNAQEAAGCLHHVDYGMTCAVASTHDDGEGNREGRSYWFPTLTAYSEL